MRINHLSGGRSFPFVVLAALGFLVCSSPAQAVETFQPGETETPWQVVNGQDRGGSFDMVTLDEQAVEARRPQRVVRVKWAEHHKKYLGFQPRPGIPVGSFEDQLDGEVTVVVYSPGNDVSHVALRLQDSRGAVYQWRQPVDVTQAGWYEFVYPVDAENFDGVWNLADGQPKKPAPPMRLLGVAFDLNKEMGRSGELMFGPIRVHGASPMVKVSESMDKTGNLPLLDAVTVDVASPDGKPAFMRLSEAQPIELAVTNHSLEPAEVNAEVILTDYADRRFPVQRQFKLQPGETVNWPLPHTPDRESIWWIDYDLKTVDGESKRSDRLSVAVFEPSGPDMERSDGFLFGLCAHTMRYPEEDQVLEIEAAGRIGTDVVRGACNWSRIEPEQGQWTWELQDRLVKLYGEQGIEIQQLLAYTPQWATTADPGETDYTIWSRKPPKPEAWREFCRQMAERYHDDIRLWEVWNEPNLGFFKGTTDEYLQMLKIAHEEIKGVDPQMNILTGGFGMSDRNPEFTETVLREGSDYYDTLAWHRHGTFTLFRHELNGLFKEWRAKYAPNKDLIFNESATRQRAVGGEREHAAQLVKRVALSWSIGARGYWWYKLRDGKTRPGVDEDDETWGLLHYDYQPRAVYVAYNAMTRLLKGMTFDKRYELGANRWLMGFKGKDKYVLLGWVQTPESPQQLIIRCKADAARVVDLMGHSRSLSMMDGDVAAMMLNRLPEYVVFDNPQSPPTIEDGVVQVSGPVLVTPQQASPLRVQVRNPLNKLMPLSVKLGVPKPYEVRQTTQTTQLAAGASSVLTFPVRLNAQSAWDANDSQGQLATLKYQLGGGVLEGQLELAMHRAVPVPERQRSPQFVLDQRSQVVSQYDHDPNTSHLVWEGAEDLSADVTLTHDAQDLILKVAVRDDKHVQHFEKHRSWKGDNIQLVFQTPGQEGIWRIDLMHTEDGEDRVFVYQSPNDVSPSSSMVQLQTTEQNGRLVYEARLAMEDLGLSLQGQRGFSFNLIVNDNDGSVREGWIGVEPGMGFGVDVSLYPYLMIVDESPTSGSEQ